jgi:hypothetical protein
LPPEFETLSLTLAVAESHYPGAGAFMPNAAEETVLA